MNEELSPEEIEILKGIVKREEAINWFWGWVKAFLAVAVPVATLYALYKNYGGQP